MLIQLPGLIPILAYLGTASTADSCIQWLVFCVSGYILESRMAPNRPVRGSTGIGLYPMSFQTMAALLDKEGIADV